MQTPTVLQRARSELVEFAVILVVIAILLGAILWLIGEIMKVLGPQIGAMGIGSALTLVACYLYVNKFRGNTHP